METLALSTPISNTVFRCCFTNIGNSDRSWIDVGREKIVFDESGRCLAYNAEGQIRPLGNIQ
jgi:hypothetical protein